MKKNDLLIIAPYQFGELSDCYYWAKYASQRGHRVTYFGYRQRNATKKRMQLPRVSIIEPRKWKNNTLFGIYFYLRLIAFILLHSINNIIVCNMPHCELLPRIFGHRNIIMDIRTLSVASDENVRTFADNHTRSIARYFNKVSCISDGVKQKLNLPHKKVFTLPLGAEELSMTRKDFQEIKLLYIGTFNNRNLNVFIKGLAKFQQKYGHLISFDIIGSGDEEVENELKSIINQTGLKDIGWHGYLNHIEAKKYFDECNVGVCFVPMTDYYDNQPATKAFEYLLSGMACIATNTLENKKVINADNGILINDDVDSTCDGLKEIYDNRNAFLSDSIRNQSLKYHWKKIVDADFLTLFD